MNSFFMRFYGRTDEEIKECVEEIKKLGVNPRRVRILDASMTANVIVPAEHLPVREARLYFDTLEETEKSRDIPGVKEVYQKWSMKNRPEGVETLSRRKEDVAWAI